MPLTSIGRGERGDVLLAGVDFSQVDFSNLYLTGAGILVLLQAVAIAAIPRRLLSARAARTWTTALLCLVGLGWASLVVGFNWPEVVRGRDLQNLLLMIGCPVVAPIASLLVSLCLWCLWIVRRIEAPSD